MWCERCVGTERMTGCGSDDGVGAECKRKRARVKLRRIEALLESFTNTERTLADTNALRFTGPPPKARE